jgi:hypothetical protein
MEEKFKVESIPDEPEYYRITKALYRKLLLIIKEKEIALMKLELGRL